MILNFGAGMVTNPGNHAVRNREVTAEYLIDGRVDEQGWWVNRPGRVLLSEVEDVETVFTYKTYIFIAEDGELRWGRLSSDTVIPSGEPASIAFHSFTPSKTVPDLVNAFVLFSPREDTIFVGDGVTPFLINISETDDPSISPFYLQKVGSFTANIIGDKTSDKNPETVKLLLQAVKVEGEQELLPERQGRNISSPVLAPRTVVSPASDPVDVQVHTGTEDSGPSTQVQIVLAEAVAEADYIDVYTTRRGSVANYYRIARMPNTDGATLVYDFPVVEETLTDELVEAGETPNFQYMAIDDFRCYAAERESNRLYFSYYDPETHERLFQNFTDFDNLELGGGQITGLHFLNDTHLIVYSSTQVHRYAVDPDIELVSVYDFITPGSDRGKSIGCTAPESIVNMGNNHYFLATNDYVYILDERGLRPISAPVHGIFQTVRKSVAVDGELRLTHAVGFAHGEEYYLSLPLPTSEDLPAYVLTHTLMFDAVTETWWQDSFGVDAVSKTDYDRVFAVVDGRLVGLYEGAADIEEPIRRVYKNNPYFRHSHSHWQSVHVYALGAAEIDITCTTEQGQASGELDIPNAGDWWSQRLGVNLRGRFYQAEIATSSPVPIDRVTINERPGQTR